MTSRQIGSLLAILLLAFVLVLQRKKHDTQLWSEPCEQIELSVAFEDGTQKLIDAHTLEHTKELLEPAANALGIALQLPNHPTYCDSLGWISERNYTLQHIRKLGKRLIRRDPQGRQREVIVLLLNGYLIEDGKLNTHIGGTSIPDDRVVALFAPALRNVITRTDTLVAQTLTHETGHLLGLVDLGVACTQPHRENGAHCTNPDCIMHWEISVIREGDHRIRHFCNSCLSDLNGVKHH